MVSIFKSLRTSHFTDYAEDSHRQTHQLKVRGGGEEERVHMYITNASFMDFNFQNSRREIATAGKAQWHTIDLVSLETTNIAHHKSTTGILNQGRIW